MASPVSNSGEAILFPSFGIPMSKKSLKKRLLDPNSSTWRNKADKYWKILVHATTEGKCAICGATKYVQAHHFIPREMASHRHVVRNGIALCCVHHKYSDELSPHQSPIALVKWLIQNKPDLYEWLLQQEPTRQNTITFKEIAFKLEDEVKNLPIKASMEAPKVK